MSEHTYVTENAIQRERLKALAAKLSDDDLRREVGAGWTVAATLAHIAFWDQRVLKLLHRFERQGVGPSPHPADVDAINDATKALCLALPPHTAAQLAVSTAEELDRELEKLSDEMLAQLAAAGNPIKLSRAEHREYHLDEIEQLIG
ncbi:MAG: DinB family protein [Chloroflexi bacterium]|nr:DinB family protein [Chloroflexota bacterium]